MSDWHGINKFGTSHSLSLTGMAVGLATALLLWYAGTHGTLASWGKNNVLQYLGRISYSLYLIHPLIIAWAKRVNVHLPHTPALTLLYWLITPLICVGVAHLLHIAVERPSVNWAARLKGRQQSDLGFERALKRDFSKATHFSLALHCPRCIVALGSLIVCLKCARRRHFC